MKFNINQNVANVTFKLKPIDDNYQMNATVELKKPLQNMFIFVKLNIPEDANDREYRRELFKTMINVEKVTKSKGGSFVAKFFLDQIMTVADFDFKFPMKAGNYTWTNIMISDKLFPFPIATKVSVESRHVGKIVGTKTSVHLYTYRAYAEVKKN
jgi:hypothetical protein